MYIKKIGFIQMHEKNVLPKTAFANHFFFLQSQYVSNLTGQHIIMMGDVKRLMHTMS